MLILSNGLTDTADEGFLNVANSLVKRIKKASPDVTVVSYDRRSPMTDRYVSLNKLLLNRELVSLTKGQRVLYIPFPAKTFATALRIFILSLFCKQLQVVLVMKAPYSPVARLLLRLSGAEVVALSAEAAAFYCTMLPARRVTHLRAGVDTGRFVPVSAERKAELREQYGFDPHRPVVLHVGHLNAGRGVGELLKLPTHYQVVLVTSTLTASEQDVALRQQLTRRENIRLITDYCPHIEELYQLSDLYFFPTVEACRCIDVPLSCLEAAACGIPVVATDYGEMKALHGQKGFFSITSFEPEALASVMELALATPCDPRQAVLPYDWDVAVTPFCEVSR